jgi:hypothetical protein
MEQTIDQAEKRTSFNERQRLFLRYFTAILVDLTVLNLFEEYWDLVVIDSFTISLFAAIVLQVLLQLTLVVEHWIASHFVSKEGTKYKVMRFFGSWAVVFLSKFVILEALDFAFGDKVAFLGPFHGLVALIVVIIAMVVAEKAIMKLYHALG